MITWRNRSYDESMDLLEPYDLTSLRNQEALASTCVQSCHWQIRMTALNMLEDPVLLARIAKLADDCEVFTGAIERLNDETLLEEVASYPCEDSYACVLALKKIEKAEILVRVAQTHPFTEVRLQAVCCITDAEHLREIAEKNTAYEVREAAVERIDDVETLVRIVRSDANTQVRKAAIARLSSPERLIDLATGTEPNLIRRSVLRHMIDLDIGYGLDSDMARRLLVCLEDYRLTSSAIALMERSGFDWCTYASEATVANLCEALTEGSAYKESNVLKKALVSLYEKCPDLRDSLALNTGQTPSVNQDIFFVLGAA